jgi:hypothetical protein
MDNIKLARFLELCEKKLAALREKYANEKDLVRQEEIEFTGLTLNLLKELVVEKRQSKDDQLVEAFEEYEKKLESLVAGNITTTTTTGSSIIVDSTKTTF